MIVVAGHTRGGRSAVVTGERGEARLGEEVGNGELAGRGVAPTAPVDRVGEALFGRFGERHREGDRRRCCVPAVVVSGARRRRAGRCDRRLGRDGRGGRRATRRSSRHSTSPPESRVASTIPPPATRRRSQRSGPIDEAAGCGRHPSDWLAACCYPLWPERCRAAALFPR